MLKGNHNPISEPAHFVLEEEVAKWMKGVGGLNQGWVGKEGANVGTGREDSMIFVAAETQPRISMLRVSTTNERHPRLFHCGAVSAVARNLRLSSLGLKRKREQNRKQAIWREKVFKGFVIRPRWQQGHPGLTGYVGSLDVYSMISARIMWQCDAWIEWTAHSVTCWIYSVAFPFLTYN